jgi:hypothetical protein
LPFSGGHAPHAAAICAPGFELRLRVPVDIEEF